MAENAELIYSNPYSLPLGKSDNLIPFINYHTPAPKRGLDMLLAKYHGQKFQTEVMMSAPEKTIIPNLKCKLSDACLLLITDGGLVPSNNPDHIPSSCANKFGIYSIKNVSTLCPSKYEVSHQGYDNTYVEQDPNRLLPLDALRELEAEGIIKSIYPYFLSTTGVMMSKKQCEQIARRIAHYVVNHPIDAVLITSACGTSTRSGTHIGLEIEKTGIPVVQITNLTQIALDNGLTRVIKGQNICYPCGNPKLSPTNEFIYRKQLVSSALDSFVKSRF